MTDPILSSRLSSVATEPLTCEPEPLVCLAPATPPAPPAESHATPVERVRESVVSRGLQVRGKVEVCSRPVDAGPSGSLVQRGSQLGARLGLDHRWLRTSEKEAGMGPATGGVPGAEFPLGQPTTLNPHTGQGAMAGSRCRPVERVDEDCVNERLRYGQFTGAWVPPFHDCHSVEEAIIDECTVPPEADASYLESKDIP